jgi:hypothetical protein
MSQRSLRALAFVGLTIAAFGCGNGGGRNTTSRTR